MLTFEAFVPINKSSRKFLDSWLRLVEAHLTNNGMQGQLERHADMVSQEGGEPVKAIKERALRILNGPERELVASAKRMRMAVRRDG